MIAWMVYSLVLSILVLAAAFALEQVLRLNGLPTRWVWLGAIVVSLLVPAILPFLPPPTFELAAPAVIPASFAIQLDAVPSFTAEATWTVPRILGAGWLGISAILVLLGITAALRLRTARQSWRRGQLTDAPVFISETTGPAVVGFLRPDIVIPDWVCGLPESNQRMILAHERAHIRARDPLLVVLSHVAPALLPWNAALWLQARRLRECVELDCDARLLAESANPNRYAELLLDVGRRTAAAPIFVAALTEPRSLLERRIRRMLEPQPRRRWLRVSGWSLAAVAAMLCAFSAPLPGEPVSIPEIIDRPGLVVHPETELPQDTSAPRLLNADRVQDAAKRFYPPLIRDAGINGTPMVWVYVDTDGSVRSTRLGQPSSHKALDEAALKVAETMRFAPAQFRGRAVAKWIEVGVEFKSDRPSPETARPIQIISEPVEYRVKPAVTNAPDVVRALERFYPPLLRDAGIGGTTVVALQVDEGGKVIQMQVMKSSGHSALDEAALKVAALSAFSPSLINGERVKAWVELPVTFDAGGKNGIGGINVKLDGQEEQDRRIEEQKRIRIRTATDEDLRRVDEARRRAAEAQSAGDVTAAPTFTPYTVKPEMTNTQDVVRMMQRVYPAELRDAGIGGTVLVWFLIDENGDVIKTQLKKSSGSLQLDEAGLAVAKSARFSPALNRDARVKVWIELPIQFKTQEPERAASNAAATSSVTGIVTDATGSPVSSATVEIVETKRGGLTSVEGRYMIRATPGTYSVLVSAPGFEPTCQEIVIVGGSNRLDLKLTK